MYEKLQALGFSDDKIQQPEAVDVAQSEQKAKLEQKRIQKQKSSDSGEQAEEGASEQRP